MKADAAIYVTLVLWGIIPLLDKIGLSGEKVEPAAGLFIRLLAAGILIVPLTLGLPTLRSSLESVSLRGWLIIALSGIISLVLSQYFYYSALKAGDVSRLFPLLFGGAPVITLAAGWLFLGEAVSLVHFAGCLLIVSGTVLLLR